MRTRTRFHGLLATALLTAACLFPARAADNFFGVGEDAAVEISPEMEKRIKHGLESLAKRQSDDGSWSSAYGKNVGEVSLALMAFMAMGNLPGEGEYGSTVAKGVNWIMAQSQSSGLIQYTGQKQQAPVMYGHALSTLMLSEAWGQTRRPDIGKVLRKAVDLIVRSQGPKGGWNYEAIPKDGDTSVSVMQILALKSAHEAGIFVNQQVIDKAVKLIRSERYDGKIFGYGYNDGRFNAGHVGSSAAGATIMLVCADKLDEKWIKTDKEKFALKPVQTHIDILNGKRDSKGMGWAPYFWYYSGVSAYAAGEGPFKQCMEALEKITAKSQRRDGTWCGGSVWETAFAILSQAMPYRYLPVYQR